MAQWAAVTALGRDRPGIVAGVTRVLYEHGCNLEDSSATRLRDEFAMILITRLPESPRLDALRAALTEVGADLGVEIAVRDLGHDPPQPPPSGNRHHLNVYGADRPGIVFRVSETLADLGCNILDVRTHITGAATSPVYILILELTVPERVETAAIAASLTRLGDELQVDITLRPVEEATL